MSMIVDPKEMYNKVVLPLFEKLEANCDQFIITGSLALYFHGFDVYPKDVDLIIKNPDNAAKMYLNSLVKENPAFSHIKDTYKVVFDAEYQFFIEKIRVDIFTKYTNRNRNKSFLRTIDGVRINTLQNIFYAKDMLGRDKDIEALARYKDYLFNIEEAPF